MTRLVLPAAESGTTADMSDDNVIHATLKKQPWDATPMTTRRQPDPRTPEFCLDSDIYWESWSLNGEVCVKGADPHPKNRSLANALMWIARGYASHCRRVHKETGAFEPLYTSPKLPSTLDMNLSLSFDLALRDPRLISERVRRRGGEPSARTWPEFWLEGSVHEYNCVTEPFPPTGTRKRRVLVLAEARQTVVSLKTIRPSRRLLSAWTRSLDVLSGVDDKAVSGLLLDDEQGYLASILVLVHERPTGRSKERFPLEKSWQHHERLVDGLRSNNPNEDLPVVWHALWRLPPSMTWCEPGGQSWMRYPAVSFVVAGRSLGSG